MAEAIGLAASLTTLLALAGQVAQLSYAYVSDVRNAPKIQKMYLQEISAFMEVLFRAEQATTDSEATGIIGSRPSSLSESFLKDCYSQLSALQSDLEKRQRRLLWPLQAKEFKKSIQVLSAFRSVFIDFVSANNLAATNATYKKLDALSIAHVKNQLLSCLQSSKEEQRPRPDPCPGTGQWFLTSPEYRVWRNGQSRTLWCCGPPGVGKSTLASLIITDLQAKAAPRPTILSFFCDFSRRQHQTTLVVLQSLLSQAIEQGNPDFVVKVNDTCGGDLSTLREPNSLCTLLGDAFASKHTYLILDAPDELDKINDVLARISSIGTKYNLVITSRESPELKRYFPKAMTMEIRSKLEDVQCYARNRLEESDVFENLSSASDLVREVVLKSDGIFLLAKLLIDRMLEQATIKKMRRALMDFPSSIEDAYKTNLQRIDAQTPAKRSLARRVLGWITHSKRPLHTQEIVEAFAVEEDTDVIDPENILRIERLRALCLGLVVIHSIDHSIGLIHTTAYEYFQDNCSGPLEGDLDIARTCILYLSLKPFQSGPCYSGLDLKNRFREMPFLDYAVEHLGSHISDPDIEEKLTPNLTGLLSLESLRSSAFQALNFPSDLNDALAEEFLESIPTGQAGLHLAACWNLKGAGTRLLKAGELIGALDSQQWSPLHYACSKGHLAVAEFLINAGAPLNLQDSQGWTPLFWASFSGSPEIVNALLINGADHLVRETLGWTALHWAVSRGEKGVVDVLLHHHRAYLQQPPRPKRQVASLTFDGIIEYSQKPSPGSSVVPMEIAAETQQLAIFDTLAKNIDASMNFEHETFNRVWSQENFDAPISNPWRTLTKSEKIWKNEVRKIFSIPTTERDLDHYSARAPDDQSEPTSWKSKLLLSAINESKLVAVRLLIDVGADVNFRSKTTPLHAAAFQEDSSFAAYLISKGADVTAIDERGYTALHHAVMNSFVSTTQTILEARADVNKRVQLGGPGWGSRRFNYRHRSSDLDRFKSNFLPESKTPLILACGPILLDSANMDVTKRIMGTLLDKGADPNIQDDTGMTALHYAATLPEPRIIEILFGYGADPRIVDNSGRSPLHVLAKYAKIDRTFPILTDTVEQILGAYQSQDTGLLVNGVAELPESRLPERQILADPPVARESTMQQEPTSGGGHDDSSEFTGIPLSEHRNSPPKRFDDREGLDAGTSPTTLALRHGRYILLEIFIEKGGYISPDFSKDLALKEAIKALQPSVVSKLLLLGAKPDDQAIRDLTVAIICTGWWQKPDEIHTLQHVNTVDEASVRRSVLILRDLLVNGAPIDWQDPITGVSALHLAARVKGAEAVLEHLLKHCADAYLQLESGLDAFHLAALYQNTAALQHLVDWAMSHPATGHWTRCFAQIQGAQDLYELICAALRSEGQINMKFDTGGTLLHYTCELGNIPLATSLLSNGADKTAADKRHFLPIHYSSFSGAKEATKILWPPTTSDGISVKAELPTFGQFDKPLPWAVNDYKTFLHCAIESEDRSMVIDLLDSGADIECKSSQNRLEQSPLYLAAKLGQLSIVDLLISRGANVKSCNKYGWAPLHIAALNGHESTVRRMIEAGADIHATTSHWGELYTYPRGFDMGREWRGQPLHLAAIQGHVDVVTLLMKHGANCKASTGAWGYVWYGDGGYPLGRSCGPTALHSVLSAGNSLDGIHGDRLDANRLLIARMLIEAGADVEGVGDYLDVQDVLKFQGYEDVWEKVRKGISDQGKTLQH
ncbi:ankyrin repeat-containing domain protein [Lophiotrema nucula]|uniref:Ankyrin repeat-containing domain protein n=1 Tax=Lophiotrema nucula TaxID=690887 RepID=A0A6A5Z0K4_9PLEO|nr:ankyrin repeat-containing domain protein [Lophiotrema nucula]